MVCLVDGDAVEPSPTLQALATSSDAIPALSIHNNNMVDECFLDDMIGGLLGPDTGAVTSTGTGAVSGSSSAAQLDDSLCLDAELFLDLENGFPSITCEEHATLLNELSSLAPDSIWPGAFQPVASTQIRLGEAPQGVETDSREQSILFPGKQGAKSIDSFRSSVSFVSTGSQNKNKGISFQTSAERQRKYRERKKQRENGIQIEILQKKQEIKVCQGQNTGLHSKEKALEQMLDVNGDLVKCIAGEGHLKKIDQLRSLRVGPSSYDNTKLTVDYDDVLREKNQINADIGCLYADVLTSFQKDLAERQGIVQADTIGNKLREILSELPSECMYQLFREQVGCILNEYDASVADDQKRKRLEVEMKTLFGMRTEAIAAMAHKDPKLVLTHLVDGWVDESFDGGVMIGEPKRIDQDSLLALIQHMEITDEQIACLCKSWEAFLASWNKSARKLFESVLNLPENPDIKEINDNGETMSPSSNASMLDTLDSRGIRGSMHDAYCMQAVRQEIDDLSHEQVFHVLKLATDICTILSPLQKSRLCVFQQGAPNCIYLPQLLTTLP